MESESLAPESPNAEEVEASATAVASAWWMRASGVRGALAATAAWIVTVAPSATSSASSSHARAIAAAALLPAVAGPLLARRHPRLGRHLGVTVFLALAALAWLLGTELSQTMDRVRGGLGVAAWAIFAVSWSHPVLKSERGSVIEGASKGLKARRQPPWYAVGAVLVGCLGSLACLVLAWQVVDVDRAVLAQTMATAAALALLSASAWVSVALSYEVSAKRSKMGSGLKRHTQRTLLWMAFVLILAVLILLMRT